MRKKVTLATVVDLFQRGERIPRLKFVPRDRFRTEIFVFQALPAFQEFLLALLSGSPFS